MDIMKRSKTRVDLHSHTFASDGRSTAAEIAAGAKRAGLHMLCLTDHHTNTKFEEVQKVVDALMAVDVFPVVGCEYSCEEGHLLVYGVVVPPDRWGRYPKAQAVVDEVNALGGCAIVPHPFKKENERMFGHRFLNIRGLAAVEVCNGQADTKTPSVNVEALKAARECPTLPRVASSDAHDAYYLGTAFTEFDGHLENAADLIAALKSGRGFTPVRNLQAWKRQEKPPRHMVDLQQKNPTKSWKATASTIWQPVPATTFEISAKGIGWKGNGSWEPN